MEFKDTQTFKNLANAFAGESQALQTVQIKKALKISR